jgi:hypothetical protein
MATVALQVHMRKNRQHMEAKKQLQQRWTDLARRMKRLRVVDEHLLLDEERLRERLDALSSAPPDDARVQVLRIEEAEVAEKRAAWRDERHEADVEWAGLEEVDARLLKTAPHFEKTEDLRHPYVLTLLAGRPSPIRGKVRSLGSAMHALIEALQKPLSRTDQLLLEIALRRCVRAAMREEDASAVRREKELLLAAEREFAAEFEWARPYVSEAARA